MTANAVKEYQEETLLNLYNTFEDECTKSVEQLRNKFFAPTAFSSYNKLENFSFYSPHELDYTIDSAYCVDDDVMKFVYILASYEQHVIKISYKVYEFVNNVYTVSDDLLQKAVYELNLIKDYLTELLNGVLLQLNGYLAKKKKMKFESTLTKILFPIIRLLVIVYQCISVDNREVLIERELFTDFNLFEELVNIFKAVELKKFSSDLVDLILKKSDGNNKNESDEWFLGVFLFFVIHFNIKYSQSVVNKVLKLVESKPPAVGLTISVFDVRNFVSKYLAPNSAVNSKIVRLKTLKDLEYFSLQKHELLVKQWIVRMNTEVSATSSQKDMLNTRITLILQGLQFVSLFYATILLTLVEQLSLEIPLSKKSLWVVVNVTNLFKKVMNEFKKKWIFIERNITIYLYHLKCSLDGFSKTMANGENVPADIIELFGDLHPKKRAIESLENFKKVKARYSSLLNLSNQLKSLNSNLNNLLYNNRNVFDIFVSEFTCKDFQIEFLMNMAHEMLEDKSLVVDKNDLWLYMESKWIRKIVSSAVEKVEKELRFIVYTQQDEHYSKSTDVGVNSVLALDGTDYLLGTGYFNLKYEVEINLSNSLFNFLTKNTNDWNIYKKMVLTARESFGLKINVHLIDNVPNTSNVQLLIEQEEKTLNYDVSIDDVKDLLIKKTPNPSLSKEFSYSFVNNCFVQNFSSSNYLLVVKPNQLTKVIRNNGFYEINALYNNLYENISDLLRKLYDLIYADTLQAQLVKELKAKKSVDIDFFALGKEILQYDLKSIERHVTCIGNVVGIIRLVNSACSLYFFNMERFLDDSNEKREKQKKTLAEENYYNVVLSNKSNTENSSNFLVNMTKTIISSVQEGYDLNLFYLLIPFISFKHVNEMISQRIELTKLRSNKGSGNGTGYLNFVDDGFYIGLSYLLVVFGQFDDFEALHFFDYVKGYYAENKETESETGFLRKLFKSKKDKKKVDLSVISPSREFQIMEQVMFCSKLFFHE